MPSLARSLSLFLSLSFSLSLSLSFFLSLSFSLSFSLSLSLVYRIHDLAAAQIHGSAWQFVQNPAANLCKTPGAPSPSRSAAEPRSPPRRKHSSPIPRPQARHGSSLLPPLQRPGQSESKPRRRGACLGAPPSRLGLLLADAVKADAVTAWQAALPCRLRVSGLKGSAHPTRPEPTPFPGSFLPSDAAALALSAPSPGPRAAGGPRAGMCSPGVPIHWSNRFMSNKNTSKFKTTSRPRSE